MELEQGGLHEPPSPNQVRRRRKVYCSCVPTALSVTMLTAAHRNTRAGGFHLRRAVIRASRKVYAEQCNSCNEK